MGRPGLIYASDGYTTHDRRFLAAAALDGGDVWFVRFDGGSRVLDRRPVPAGVVEVDWLGAREPLTDARRGAFAAAFRSLVTDLGAGLVHAGPVPTVGEVTVSSSPVPVVVMSWASDLLVDALDPDVAVAARTALTGAAHVLVDNEAVAAVAAGLGARDISVVPWGVDLDAFPEAPPRPDDGVLRIVSLRSFETIYDVATLVRATASVRRPVHVTLAGSGTLEPDLRRAAAGLPIEFVGRVPEDDLPALLADHDVHVSTSTSDGTSISLLQAMATGRPSLVTDIASNRVWVPDGWRFPVGDADALAAAIDGLHDVERAGSDARRTAETRADWTVNARRIHDVYEAARWS